MERRVFNLPLNEIIIPYEHNPRQNDAAVDAVAESIKAFGPQSPIIVDKNNVIICGHTLLDCRKFRGFYPVPWPPRSHQNPKSASKGALYRENLYRH